MKSTENFWLDFNCLAPIDNSRYGEVEFTIPTTGTMHGFAGFFEAKLYKDIAISKLNIL